MCTVPLLLLLLTIFGCNALSDDDLLELNDIDDNYSTATATVLEYP